MKLFKNKIFIIYNMKTRYARRVRSKKTRRTRRHRRRAQKGGWGGYRPAPTIIEKQKKESNILFGGWGPVMQSV